MLGGLGRVLVLADEVDVFLADVGAEHGRIVGVQVHEQTGLHHPVDRVGRQIGPAVDDGGRRGTTGEVDPVVAAARDYCVVFENVIAVVDSLATEQVEARRDVRGRTVLRGMTRQVQTRLTREAKALEELLRRIRRLGRVHAQPDHLVAPVREHLFGHLQRHGRRILAVDVRDQAAAHTEVVLGGATAVDQTLDDRRHRDAPRRVQGRVEEHLPVLQIAELDAVLERLVGNAREVARFDHRRVDEPEDLQELVDRLVVVDAVDIRRGQCDVVLPCEVGDRLGSQRSLDVTMQFDLRQLTQVLGVLHQGLLIRGRLLQTSRA